MDIVTIYKNSPDYPAQLLTLHSPPKQLIVLGASLPGLLERQCVAVVGSRKISSYGRHVTRQITRELAEQGIVIISGLAYGVDAEAHRAALVAGGLTIAVLPGPVDDVYPSAHYGLAMQIVESGGCLVSEYKEQSISFKGNFVARNRIVAGLANAVLVTEAEIRSGSRHTVGYAFDAGKPVMAVPGNITSLSSAGTNDFIQKSKAGLATCAADVLDALGLVEHRTRLSAVKGQTPHEQAILDVMLTGVMAGHEILAESGLSVSQYNHSLTMLEINGKVRPLGADNWMIT